jgi:hypothetical protein
MLTDDNFKSLDIASLALGCKQETGKFFKNLANDARYCFELWCRACRDHLEGALEYIFKIYVPILYSRARQHPAFYQSCQDANSFAHTALANFYHAVNGTPFLEKFQTLPQVMGYLYTCLHTELLGDIRRTEHETPLEDDPQMPSEEIFSDSQEVWAQLCRVLPDPKDQRLAYLRFVLEMKPAEIVKQYPALWETQREVTIALYRIRRLLRRDLYLRRLAGATDETKDNALTKNEGISGENDVGEGDTDTQTDKDDEANSGS